MKRTAQDEAAKRWGGTASGSEGSRKVLAERDLIDLVLVRRRIREATGYGDESQAPLFGLLRPVAAEFILSTLDRVIGDE